MPRTVTIVAILILLSLLLSRQPSQVLVEASFVAVALSKSPRTATGDSNTRNGDAKKAIVKFHGRQGDSVNSQRPTPYNLHLQPNSDNEDDNGKKHKNTNSNSIASSDGENNNIITDSYQFPATILCLCWGITFLSSLDKVAMSVALVPLSQEFGYVTETIKGQISSLFSVGYALGILPMGLLLAVATVSPRIVMAVGLALWSTGTLLTPLAVTASGSGAFFLPLLGARFAVGAAESVVFPTIQRLLAAWIPDDQRSTATAIILSGFQMGTVASFLFSPYVMDSSLLGGGWQGLFLVYGGIGFVWLIPWLLLAKDAPPSTPQLPTTHTTGAHPSNEYSISETEDLSQSSTSLSLESTLQTLQSAPLREIVASRGVQAVVIAQAANNWGMYISVAWTPTFYAEQYGMNVKDSAFLSVGPTVAGILCGVLAGIAADTWIRNTNSITNNIPNATTRIRKTFQGVGLYGSAICLAALANHVPEEPWLAQALLVGVVGLQAFNTGGYAPGPQEKAGPKWSGLLYSLTSLPGILLGSLGVYTTGQILDTTGQDWGVVFTVNAIVNVIGATGFMLLYNSDKEFE